LQKRNAHFAPFVEIESGKSADALDLRPQLAAALKLARKQSLQS
jgi:hypothetical protein